MRRASPGLFRGSCTSTTLTGLPCIGGRRAANSPTRNWNPETPSGRALTGLHFVLWGVNETCGSLRESMARFRQTPCVCS